MLFPTDLDDRLLANLRSGTPSRTFDTVLRVCL